MRGIHVTLRFKSGQSVGYVSHDPDYTADQIVADYNKAMWGPDDFTPRVDTVDCGEGRFITFRYADIEFVEVR